MRCNETSHLRINRGMRLGFLAQIGAQQKKSAAQSVGKFGGALQDQLIQLALHGLRDGDKSVGGLKRLLKVAAVSIGPGRVTQVCMRDADQVVMAEHHPCAACARRCQGLGEWEINRDIQHEHDVTWFDLHGLAKQLRRSHGAQAKVDAPCKAPEEPCGRIADVATQPGKPAKPEGLRT